MKSRSALSCDRDINQFTGFARIPHSALRVRDPNSPATALGPPEAFSDNAAPNSIESLESFATMAGTRHHRSHVPRRLAPWRKTPDETGVLPSSSDDATRPHRGLFVRSASALRRRAAYAWRRLTAAERGPAVPAVMTWLAAQAGQGGLATTPADPLLCPGLSGAALTTLAAYGQLELARRCAEWLLS